MRIRNDLRDLWEFISSCPGGILAYIVVVIALAILASTVAEYICR